MGIILGILGLVIVFSFELGVIPLVVQFIAKGFGLNPSFLVCLGLVVLVNYYVNQLKTSKGYK